MRMQRPGATCSGPLSWERRANAGLVVAGRAVPASPRNTGRPRPDLRPSGPRAGPRGGCGGETPADRRASPTSHVRVTARRDLSRWRSIFPSFPPEPSPTVRVDGTGSSSRGSPACDIRRSHRPSNHPVHDHAATLAPCDVAAVVARRSSFVAGDRSAVGGGATARAAHGSRGRRSRGGAAAPATIRA